MYIWKGLNMMKKESEVPQLDIIKFSMDTDIMTSSPGVDVESWENMPGT